MAFLNVAHSIINDYDIYPSTFLIPSLAGLLFGYQLAKNKILNLRMIQLASTDMLTGIYNRMQFDRFLKAEIEKADRYGGGFSIIYIDLDCFKKINDRYGHHIGDQTLTIFANVITNANRVSDIFARYGGEEFVVLTHAPDIKDAIKHAERLRKAIEAYDFPDIDQLTCSFGVAAFKPNEDEEKDLIKRADAALYEAKNAGRNRVCAR
ncbi:MAG: GGDEF domain-containing protein [Gammaproteobacteria bacterium]|nr:GGDEF domain-containing protein [Gammaproteobacteria bacterium]